MTTDISRKSFNHRKNYSGLICEQGRVQLDSEWNEAAAIADRRWRAETFDIFGPCRVPRETPDAFRIAINNGGLTIGLGRMYVDGLLVENHGEPTDRFDSVLAELTGTIALPFDQQPFLSEINFNDLADGRYLVYLDVWYRDVTSIEDPMLIEKAVGIPTTSRRQTVWQVKVYDEELGVDVFCSTLNEDIPGWLDLILPSDGRLSTQAVGVPSIEGPCLLPPSGGYRGLENRTYCVHIHSVDDDGNATFKWSRHNATVTSAVNAIPSNTTLSVESTKKDTVLRFNNGDWVEILDDALEFSDQPGIVRRILVDDETNTMTLDVPLPLDRFPTVDADENLNPDRHTRVRRWDQSGEIRDTNDNLIVDLDADGSEGVIPVPVPGTSIELEDGVEITFNDFSRDDGRYRVDDFWILTTRTIDASVEELDHQPPCGINHHYCRLALVDVVNNEFTAVAEDCRIVTPEDPGVSQECCSVTVSLNESIQEAINSLPVQGGKICLLPGEYQENIRIENRPNITLAGCGKRTRIISIVPNENSAEAEPVINIINSQEIRIESLAVEAHTTGVGILVEETAADPNTRETHQVANIVLIDLYINAAIRSGIEIQAGNDIIIRGCLVEMGHNQGDWPGIFLIAQDALIQENEIRVVPSQQIPGTLRSIIGNGRGGIQIGGTSEQVRVINNLIHIGIGNGITLGSLEQVDDSIPELFILFPWWPINFSEPCDECDPVTPRIPPLIPPVFDNPDDNDDERIFRSSGPLYDITIEDNRIYDMGLNGIGVAGFFDLSVIDEFITINGLTICNNDIQRCLSRPLAPIDTDMIDSMGYGGIALADVENIVICHNKIENNGPSYLEPICGIFILHAEGVDISDNRILNNGAKFNTQEEFEQGRRGGINIVLAIAPTEVTRIRLDLNSTVFAVASTFPRQNGVPAAKIHDNIISQPVGRALSLAALGPVSIVNNQFTSRGVPSRGQLTAASIGTVVIIANLGVSNELYGQLLNFSGIVSESAGSLTLATVPVIEQGAIVRSQEGLDDFRAGQYLANGNVLFSDNQCVLDLLETSLIRVHTSIVIFSLDDIDFSNNQCDCSLYGDFVYVQTLIMGASVRVSDNRFKEGVLDAAFSALTIGFMNATTNNQATHCLLVTSLFPNAKVYNGNKILIENFISGYCTRNRDFLNTTSFMLRER